jgi:hypothetical protein
VQLLVRAVTLPGSVRILTEVYIQRSARIQLGVNIQVDFMGKCRFLNLLTCVSVKGISCHASCCVLGMHCFSLVYEAIR